MPNKMNKLKTAIGVAGVLLAAQAMAQVTFYEGEQFRGQAFTADQTIWDFEQYDFNDRARSAVVDGGRWQVCEDAQFAGRCVVLRPGSYATLAGMGLSGRISSVRPLDPPARVGYDAPQPLAAQNSDYRRRPDEQLYEAPVTSVHAVVGPPEQRCWIERQEVRDDRGGANVPGAIAGAIIGGILGHQVGGGHGRDAATIGGVVAGGAIGANVGRDRDGSSYGQDVQRCENVQSQAPPDYWDVTYTFEGVQHRMQLNAPPGRTITVNRDGEPRG